MNAQPDLFIAARTTDPETSKQAARSMRGAASAQQDQIVNALRAFGPMNHAEIDDALKWDHPRAARRMKELVKAGRVRMTGETRRTGTGRPATLYEARL